MLGKLVVWPGEEKAPGKAYSSLPVLRGRLQERWGQTISKPLLSMRRDNGLN